MKNISHYQAWHSFIQWLRPCERINNIHCTWKKKLHLYGSQGSITFHVSSSIGLSCQLLFVSMVKHIVLTNIELAIVNQMQLNFCRPDCIHQNWQRLWTLPLAFPESERGLWKVYHGIKSITDKPRFVDRGLSCNHPRHQSAEPRLPTPAAAAQPRHVRAHSPPTNS